jgi:AcrR family transcriptional regulator
VSEVAEGKPAPRRGRPPAADSEETRQRLLRAARTRFSETGYARTSMADIARAAEVTPRAIYYYFDSKADLFEQAAVSAYHRFAAEIAQRVFAHDDTRARLHGFVDVFRALFQEDPDLVAFICLAGFESSRHPELPGPKELTGDLPDINEMLVRDAVERGALARDISPEGAVALLDVFGTGLTLLANSERQEDYLAMLDVVDRFLDGSLFAE